MDPRGPFKEGEGVVDPRSFFKEWGGVVDPRGSFKEGDPRGPFKEREVMDPRFLSKKGGFMDTSPFELPKKGGGVVDPPAWPGNIPPKGDL